MVAVLGSETLEFYSAGARNLGISATDEKPVAPVASGR